MEVVLVVSEVLGLGRLVPVAVLPNTALCMVVWTVLWEHGVASQVLHVEF